MKIQRFEGPLERLSDCCWRIPKNYKSGMRVDGLIFANEQLIERIRDDPAPEQVANVAFLPGIQTASLAMPDIHWGYGFPIGGVCATDPADQGVISPGGVGYDINCGVRLVRTNLTAQAVSPHLEELIEQLLAKQEFANYLVTQMCFDAARINSWLREIRGRGVHFAAWLGMPGAADRASLIKTSLRIGVGDSVRFLKRQGKRAAQLMAAKEYLPDNLQLELASTIADPDLNVAGQHVFCFNQVERSEAWRHEFVASIRND